MINFDSFAQRFHEAYERLAPKYNYETRAETAIPWSEIPDANKKLMIAVCTEVLIDLLDAWICEGCSEAFLWVEHTPPWRDSEGICLCEKCSP